MANILNTGLGALNAFQRQLATTGHNIANVNTEGYSRQRVQFETLEPQGGSAGYIGSGVKAASIRRSYDDFLAGQVRSYNASHEEYRTYQGRAAQIDNVVGDAAAGLSRMMQDFFASIQDLSVDPTSIPARTVMLNRAEMLSDRFQSLNGWMEDQRNGLNRDLQVFVEEVNGISGSIASVNRRIQAAAANEANPPNDLLDERDRLVDQLSGYVNVDTLLQDDGSMNVFIGTGQALVVGGSPNRLSVTPGQAAVEQKEVSIALAGAGTAAVTDQLTGGRLGGLLRFRGEVLDPAQNALGLVAIGLAQNFNDQHLLGTDLDGNAGTNFFSLGTPQALANSANAGTGTLAAAFDVPTLTNLTGHEYRLDYDGANWSISDTATGSTSVLGPPGVYVHDGVELTLAGAAAAGDSFVLRPTRSGAAAMDALLTDPREIAAAQSAAAGDNRNAQALTHLQSSALMFGNTATLGDAYGYMVADVGTRTHQAGANADVQEQLLGQAENAKSAVSGVNLDEEAADLVRFQQAYSAAAQVIATANTLFDTLLGAVRG